MSDIMQNFTKTSKKLLNILHYQNEEKNLNLLEIFSKHFEVQMSKTCLTSKSYAFFRKMKHVSPV